MRNVSGRAAPRAAAWARKGGDASVSLQRRGRTRRIAAPPRGAFREDERGSGAATTTAEPDPKSPQVPNAASETNILASAEASGASGGWWAWTKRWALGDSDEDSDEDAPSSAEGEEFSAMDASASSDAPEADPKRLFLNRVPLPPWLKDQVATRVFPDAIEIDPVARPASSAVAIARTPHGKTRVERVSEEARDSRETRTRADEARDDDDPPSPVAAAGSVAATREVPDATAAMSNAPDDAFRVRPRDVDHPRDVENVEAFVDALDDGGIVGDATVNKSGALAASVTRAAVDTLEDALAAVEARAEAKERKTRRAASALESAEDDAGEDEDGGRSTDAGADSAASELKLALETARRRAAEARVAGAALDEAARDVAKAREAMRASSASGYASGSAAGPSASALSEETDTQRRRRLRGALGAAGDRLLAASAASRAAAAAASASLRNVAFFDDDDPFWPLEVVGGAAVKSSAVKTSGVNNESRRKSSTRRYGRAESKGGDASRDDEAEDVFVPSSDARSRTSLRGSFEALELSGAVSRVTEWSVSRVFGKSAEKASGKGRVSASALSDAVAPALARVVAQSLEPSSPADLRHARVACGLAAWIYYLPTAHKSLAKFGLRMVVSSMGAEKQRAASRASSRGGGVHVADDERDERVDRVDDDSDARGARDSVSSAGDSIRRPRERPSRTTRADEMGRRAIRAADAAIEELARVAANPGTTPTDSVDAAREAARLVETVSEHLDALREEADETSACETRSAESRSNARVAAADAAGRGGASSSASSTPVAFASNAVASPSAKRAPKLPVAYAVAADDAKGTLWISIEGSTSLASWQTNLTFQPVPFEDPALDVRVHRGAYEAARVIYDAVEGCVREHVATHGSNARVHVTGHSIGGSLAMVLGLMLILRGAAEKKHVADVWTFGAPYVLCGGDALLRRLGLPRSFIKSVAMGKDIVPRSFSCYYPEWARRALEMAPGALRVDVEAQKSFLEEEMFYSPVGDMFLLQAMHGSAHPLLPPGPGLYQLAGDGLFDDIAAKVVLSGNDASAVTREEDMEHHWLDRRVGAGWGEWFGDDREDAFGGVASAAAAAGSSRTRAKSPPARVSSLNRLACLTQHDAALTASLILGSVDTRDVEDGGAIYGGESGTLSALLQEKGRDAARRVVLNTPHPLTVLSDPKAYGNAGSISRHHNPFNYLRALGKTRRVWESGSQPRRNDVADALGSADQDA